MQITADLVAEGINFKDAKSSVNNHRGLDLQYFAPNVENDPLNIPNIKEVLICES